MAHCLMIFGFGPAPRFSRGRRRRRRFRRRGVATAAASFAEKGGDADSRTRSRARGVALEGYRAAWIRPSRPFEPLPGLSPSSLPAHPFEYFRARIGLGQHNTATTCPWTDGELVRDRRLVCIMRQRIISGAARSAGRHPRRAYCNARSRRTRLWSSHGRSVGALRRRRRRSGLFRPRRQAGRTF